MEPVNLKEILKKISYTQLIFLLLAGIICFIFNQINSCTAFLIAGIFSFIYTQFLRLSVENKFLTLFGFPLRLLLIVPPVAILIHKLNSNLIALFIGFAISLVIYFIFIWLSTRDYKKSKR